MSTIVHDYCKQKSVTPRQAVREPYYSNFVLRGGARNKPIDYRSRDEVCRACTKQGTTHCVYVKEQQQKKRNLTRRLGVKKEGEESTLVRFRSSLRGK